MKYGIIGLRDFNGEVFDNFECVNSALNCFKPSMTGIVSGGGKGAERLVQRWATEQDVDFKLILPNIKTHGKKDAFLIRNLDILKEADELIIFWDGMNLGNIKAIGHAMKDNICVHVLPVR